MDRETRKALIEKYLEAETTPSEEQRLREWFSSHPAEGDEQEIALLIGLSAPCGHCLPETGDGEAEFDRIVATAESGRRRRLARWPLWTAAAAAAVALLLWLVPTRRGAADPLTPIQIAEGIQQMMLLDIGDIESIVATPAGSYAILTAQLKDGNSCSFILTCNEDEGTTSLLACSNSKE